MTRLFQLASYRDPDTVEPDYGWPETRWEQTFEIGFTPNQGLPNVHIAVAMDLPDFEADPYVSLQIPLCLKSY